MTATPAPALTAAEQRTVDRFDAAPYPMEVAEARRVLDAIVEGEQEIASGKPLVTLDAVMAEAALVETVARAIHAVDDCVGSPLLPWDDLDTDRAVYRKFAAAAIAAYRAAQDGGAEEAVRRGSPRRRICICTTTERESGRYFSACLAHETALATQAGGE